MTEETIIEETKLMTEETIIEETKPMTEETIIEETKPKFETMFTKQNKKQGIITGEPKLKKYGQELNVREWINENNVDCEIYETLDKYGTIKQNKANLEQIVGEMEQLDFREYLDRKIAEENHWKSLPIEIRKEFNNDPNEFMKNGIEWMNKEIEKNKPKPAPEPAPEPTPTEGE